MHIQVKWASVGLIAGSTMLLATLFGQANQTWESSAALLALSIGGAWLVGLWRGWRLTANIGFGGLVGLAGVGAATALPAGGLLLAVCGALAAWDLHRLVERLAHWPAETGSAALIGYHLWRLGVVIGSGLLLGGLAITVQLELSLAGVAVLGLLAALTFGWTMSRLRQQAGKK